MDGASCSATCAAWSSVAPSAMACAAAHAQQLTPKLAVPVSTSRTGTGTAPTARRAALSVPDSAAPTCTDRMDVHPRAMRSSYAAANWPGLGRLVVTTGGTGPS